MAKKETPRILDLTGATERSSEANVTYTTQVVAYNGEFGEAVRLEIMSPEPLDATRKQELLVEAIGVFRRAYQKWPLRNTKKESQRVLRAAPKQRRQSEAGPGQDASPPSSAAPSDAPS